MGLAKLSSRLRICQERMKASGQQLVSYCQAAFDLGHWFDCLLFRGRAIRQRGLDPIQAERQLKQARLPVKTRTDFHNLAHFAATLFTQSAAPVLFFPRTLCLRGPQGEVGPAPAPDGPTGLRESRQRWIGLGQRDVGAVSEGRAGAPQLLPSGFCERCHGWIQDAAAQPFGVSSDGDDTRTRVTGEQDQINFCTIQATLSC